MKAKRRKLVRTHSGIPLTEKQWKELEITGCVIAGDNIIRTLAFVKRGQDTARKEIARTAKRLFC